MQKRQLSAKTRGNWLIDAVVFLGGIFAALSGIYFLYLPSGGYRGGRNPAYGIQILFDRHTWSDLHIITGVLMVAAVIVHFAIHWRWVVTMARKVAHTIRTRESGMSRGAWKNLILDVIVGLSFLLCAVSGIALLFVPEGSGGGPSTARLTWDMMHTWSGVVLIGSAIVHFAIHWRWVKNVTLRLVASLLPARPEPTAVAQPGLSGGE
ncbi:MAG: DUF4405 domain-containing protein [Anaerolineae bacterium]|nr:DUF4405 domain-containing protein [Anaerolineae bacterium]